MPDHAKTQIRCDNCGSTGFNASAYEPGNCEFCDGSFGGNPTDPAQDAREMMCAMYGSQLYPYQTELLTRIMVNYCRDDVINSMVLDSIPHQITGNRADFVIFDEAHHIKELWNDAERSVYLSHYAWDQDFTPDNRGEKDWKRSMFKQDTASSTPSAAKRAKLRAKRKKRK